jgi:hypothetical protein
MQRFTAVETARVVYRAGPLWDPRFTLTEFFLWLKIAHTFAKITNKYQENHAICLTIRE